MTIDNLYEKALAEMTKPTPDLELVKGLLEQSHSGGDPRATYALGSWYLHGSNVKKNIAVGMKYIRKAAKDNEPNALYDMAVCYETGKGVKRNLSLAFENYMSAALHGDKQAIYEVGRCYYYGIGIPGNKRIAAIWLDCAREAGITDAES